MDGSMNVGDWTPNRLGTDSGSIRMLGSMPSLTPALRFASRPNLIPASMLATSGMPTLKILIKGDWKWNKLRFWSWRLADAAVTSKVRLSTDKVVVKVRWSVGLVLPSKLSSYSVWFTAWRKMRPVRGRETALVGSIEAVPCASTCTRNWLFLSPTTG